MNHDITGTATLVNLVKGRWMDSWKEVGPDYYCTPPGKAWAWKGPLVRPFGPFSLLCINNLFLLYTCTRSLHYLGWYCFSSSSNKLK